jgi:lipopolysaccharide heptosyltransferase I
MKKDNNLRILIVKLSSFGDIVHTFPALAYLRASLPEERIDWLVEKRFAALPELVNGIDNIISADISSWRKRPLSINTFRSIGQLKRTLRGNEYDLVLDFQGLLKSAVYARLSGARIKAGFAPGFLRERAAAVFYNRKIRPDTSQKNVVYKNLSFMQQSIGALVQWLPGNEIQVKNSQIDTDCSYIFKQNPEAKKRIKKYLNDIDERKFILMHTGSSSPNKLMPEKSQAELCDLVWQNRRLKPVFCGSGNDLVNARRIASLCLYAEPVILESSLEDLAEAMRMSYAFIGPDSGPLHLAAALGTKTIGYYGPTDPNRNGPIGKDVLVVEPAHPCRRPSCWKKCADNVCLKSLHASDILNLI